jgi:lipid II:glycine glycyltransferase (peptidoglycan interpeptide bridge formation enzyme)
MEGMTCGSSLILIHDKASSHQSSGVQSRPSGKIKSEKPWRRRGVAVGRGKVSSDALKTLISDYSGGSRMSCGPRTDRHIWA